MSGQVSPAFRRFGAIPSQAENRVSVLEDSTLRSYNSLVEHPLDHEIELYSLGRIRDERLLALFETHLLACLACQGRVSHMDKFVTAIRRFLNANDKENTAWSTIEIIALHATHGGNVYLWIAQRPWGDWVGKVRGQVLDSGTSADSYGDAVSEAEGQFWRMFPEHVCGPGCISGSPKRSE